MPVTVGEAIKSAAAALQMKPREFLDELIRFVTPDVGGDSDPSRDTILSYLQAEAERTRCGYKFAGMILDHLHVHRERVRDTHQFARVHRYCQATLIENRKLRYSAAPKTNAASQRRIAPIGGVYLLLRRRASGDHSVQQELLILSHEGRGDMQTFATYVTPELVCRGTWCVIQQNVCCMMHGFRGAYKRRDVVNLHLFYDDPDPSDVLTFLTGFITGITSHALRPVALSIVGVRAPNDLSPQIKNLGDRCDAELRASWAAATAQNSKLRFAKLERILDASMAPQRGAVVLNERAISEAVSQEYRTVNSLFSKDVLGYLKGYPLD